MSDDKINVSWDDIQSVPDQPSQPQVTPPFAIENRESWGHVNPLSPGGQSSLGQQSAMSILYKGWFYLGVAGLLAGLLAWGIQEMVPIGFGPSTTEYVEWEQKIKKKAPEEWNTLNKQEQRFLITELLYQDIAKKNHPNWESMTEKQQQNVIRNLKTAQTRLDMGKRMALIGAILALGLAMAEGIVSRSTIQAIKKGAIGLLVGIIGGFIAGVLAQWIYVTMQSSDPKATENGITAVQVIARTLGWGVVGGLIGSTFGIVYLSIKRSILGMAGGLIGGLLGGLLFDLIGYLGASDVISRLVGIVAIGCISGILISLAEEVAKSAWVKIEAGRLIGKQFIIYRNPTRIGALPANDIYLFKDRLIDPKHATIEQRGNAYFMVDRGTSTGTRINGKLVQNQKLQNGDAIQIGETILRYGERHQS